MKTLLHITIRAEGAKPVESGKRATAKGYKPCVPHCSIGTWKFKNNFTGLFFNDGTHMTWAYGKGLCFPEGVKEGDYGTIEFVGKYSDSEVACFVVTFNGLTHQP
jgi:hypothetical protein